MRKQTQVYDLVNHDDAIEMEFNRIIDHIVLLHATSVKNYNKDTYNNYLASRQRAIDWYRNLDRGDHPLRDPFSHSPGQD